MGRMALGLAMAMIASQTATAGTIGVIHDLGAVRPRGVSASGQVVGIEKATGSVTLRDGKTEPSSPLPGQSNYAAISPGGTIVSQAKQQATIRQGDGPFEAAGGLRSGASSDHSEPRDVNDSGTVVGSSRASLRDNHAFASTPGASDGSSRKVVDLGTLGGKNSAATAINNEGTIVGQADNGRWGARAFAAIESSYRETTPWSSSNLVSSALTDLGTLGGKNSAAYAINEAGLIVGASNIRDGQSQFTSDTAYGSNEAVHAFMYDGNGGGMQDLGTLPGFQTSVAASLNNLGQIVGYASDAGLDLVHYYDATNAYGNAHAFLYEDGKLSDLNDLLPLDSGWILRTAVGINDAGQVVGSGLYHGEDRGYLLELGQTTIQAAPVPEPATLAMFSIIAAGVVARRRKRA